MEYNTLAHKPSTHFAAKRFDKRRRAGPAASMSFRGWPRDHVMTSGRNLRQEGVGIPAALQGLQPRPAPSHRLARPSRGFCAAGTAPGQAQEHNTRTTTSLPRSIESAQEPRMCSFHDQTRSALGEFTWGSSPSSFLAALSVRGIAALDGNHDDGEEYSREHRQREGG